MLSGLGVLLLAVGLAACGGSIALGPPKYQLFKVHLYGTSTFCWDEAEIMGMDLGSIGWGDLECKRDGKAGASDRAAQPALQDSTLLSSDPDPPEDPNGTQWFSIPGSALEPLEQP